MKTIKVSEATPLQLNWLVAKCEDITWWAAEDPRNGLFTDRERTAAYSPSNDWSQGGPIVERYGVQLYVEEDHSRWTATRWGYAGCQYGPTPLVAAMRCYVASKLGDEVEIPEELT
jgi:hypothetical protein